MLEINAPDWTSAMHVCLPPPSPFQIAHSSWAQRPSSSILLLLPPLLPCASSPSVLRGLDLGLEHQVVLLRRVATPGARLANPSWGAVVEVFERPDDLRARVADCLVVAATAFVAAAPDEDLLLVLS